MVGDPRRVWLSGKAGAVQTEDVGIFPGEAVVIRLVSAILLEQKLEWAVQRARYTTLESVAAVLDDPIVTVANRAE